VLVKEVVEDGALWALAESFADRPGVPAPGALVHPARPAATTNAVTPRPVRSRRLRAAGIEPSPTQPVPLATARHGSRSMFDDRE
jgi:hypothetical protein